MATRSEHIRVVCSSCYGPKKHCNIFTKEVARNLGVYLPGGTGTDANALMDALRGQWRQISATEATFLSENGEFILCGLKSDEFVPRKDGRKTVHGHVCVVVTGQIGGFPNVFSTNESNAGHWDGKSKGDKPLSGWVFSHADAKNVRFYAPPLVLSDTI